MRRTAVRLVPSELLSALRDLGDRTAYTRRVPHPPTSLGLLSSPVASGGVAESATEVQGFSSDADLLAALRRGEEAAYAHLVRLHGGRMLAVAKRLLKVESEAEDAVQDAFLSAFRSLDSFEGEAKLGTWLHRIVVNASLMRLRNRKRRPETPIDDLLPRFLEDGHYLDPPQPWHDDAEQLLQDAERRRWVRDRIDTLPDTYRTVLMLRDIENLSTQDAADLLGITPNAVKIRLHRARLALREILDREFRGGER